MHSNGTESFGVARGVTYDWTVNVAVGAVFTLVGCIAVSLRLLALILRNRPAGFDDLAMYLAFLANIGFTVASYVSIRCGVGLHPNEVPIRWAITAVKAVYVIEIFYYLAVFFIKMSLMFLYLRIANGLGNRFYKGTLITMVTVIVHFASTVVVEAIQCIPMEKYWDPTVSGHCINITAFFYSTNTFTIITDLIILGLPIPTLLKVNRPRAQKVGLLAAFLVGGLSTLASCVRLYSVRIYTESNEPMRDAAPINTWSFIEVNLGILCASVPAIKPLFLSRKQESGSSSCDISQENSKDSATSGVETLTPTHQSTWLCSLPDVVKSARVELNSLSETRRASMTAKIQALVGVRSPHEEETKVLSRLEHGKISPTAPSSGLPILSSSFESIDPQHPSYFSSVTHNRSSESLRHFSNQRIMVTRTVSVTSEYMDYGSGSID